ncbi:MAG: hypothetical protein MUO29_08925, partial [Desulfobacterales bacterium]|nr:hypothetical protein [Desulfobacterales bacterium]
SRTPFDFQDLFPLIGGDYSLSVLIKNEASKEFTSVEQTLRIPLGGTAVPVRGGRPGHEPDEGSAGRGRLVIIYFPGVPLRFPFPPLSVNAG